MSHAPDQSPQLFTALTIGHLSLTNRIVIPPMCQYSAQDGNANDWHSMHYGSLAVSGAGLLIIEATAVAPEGRITAWDVGLYSDDNQAALTKLRKQLAHMSTMPVAIQLAHAGRKASCQAPWHGGANIAPNQPNGWQTVSASALPHNDIDAPPRALSKEDITQVIADFVRAAQRADAAGIDGIELHMAHGYLVHQFLSPLSNQRDDEYGGSLENRMRFALQLYQAVRQAFNPSKPVWVRISASDWVDGGWDLESSVTLSKALKALGAPIIHVSSGGLSPQQTIPLEAGYQVGFATAIKKAADIAVIAVGLITTPAYAEALLASGQADAIGIGRAALYDPRWPWHAAAELGAQVDAPPQYWRSQPREFKALFRSQ
ncbi:NADH:flavin oxidoreductase/NADH oxidase [Lampropedia aestuarii]|uniref:NADH:flavin oxidoreductase/NADH oxidase n=1 Tax=Lampropedia aestuarii TaxID=2562762 RepID=UPI002468B20C|nr:NADH:flavin oxidoreductase/NADH oxidase [Lampropedia aestuarii]MDH5858430.1 NADH:flavin oxidoreductase/NADH oxidase [Lampropedia aestuarii]